ncbi:MAG: hypothetical protein ACKV2V_03640 [Blastocatellia bacterium]
MALALFQLDRRDEALAVARRSLSKGGENFTARYVIGLFHVEEKNWAQARDNLRAALAAPATGDWSEYRNDINDRLGMVLAGLKEAERTISSLEQRLETEPQLLDERFELGSLYIRAGKYALAEARIEYMRKNYWPDTASDLQNLLNELCGGSGRPGKGG